MILVLAFLKTHWRPIAAVVALVLAFGAGRFATPTKVITKTEVQTKVVTQVQTVEVEKRVEVAAKAQVVYVDRIIEKDGTIHEHSVTKSEETSKTTDNTAEKTTAKQDATTDTKTEKTVLHDAPRFTVSLLSGVQLKPSINLIPNAGPFTLGLAFQYRIAGPLQVGIFGLTTGAFGVSLGATF